MFLCLICSLIAYFGVYLVCIHLVLLPFLKNIFSGILIATRHALTASQYLSIHASSIKVSKFVLDTSRQIAQSIEPNFLESLFPR